MLKPSGPKRKLLFFIVGLLAVSLVSSGCEPLRKKFKRKKKKDKEVTEELPVLEPIDYPKPEFSASKEYKRHYSLWRIWHNDLMKELQEDESQKRQLYSADQLIIQLTEMQKLLAPEKQQGLTDAISAAQGLRKDLEASSQMRSRFAMKKRLETIAKSINKDYKFEVIEGSLISE